MRLRFPPSPTGKIHIGNMRTALFNWLWARNNEGKFILRIEDTDQERSSKEFEDLIIKELDWLGLDIDEGVSIGGKYGPYRQSERKNIYLKYIQKLLDSGQAYYCYCTKEELDKMREDALAKGEMPKYNGKCRDLSLDQSMKFQKEGKPFVIRFKLPEEDKDITFYDLIRGKITVNTSMLDDFVIIKSDGMPTYNFAAVVDDALMGISQVIRGEDHISNTPKQILLYKALSFNVPEFAHLPLILDENKAKLKKRSNDNTVYVGEFRKKGYLPEALFNYLALLGWSPDGNNEIVNKETIIQQFDITKVNKSGAVFDINKLNFINHQYIQDANLQYIYDLSIEYLFNANYLNKENYDAKFATELIDFARKKVDYLAQIPEVVSIFFNNFSATEEAQKEFQKESTRNIFQELLNRLPKIKDNFIQKNIITLFHTLRNDLSYSAKEIYMPIMLALIGQSHGPQMAEIMYFLSYEKTIERLKKALTL